MGWQTGGTLRGQPAYEVAVALHADIDAKLDAHQADPTPHPAYDDLPDMSLLFENGLV